MRPAAQALHCRLLSGESNGVWLTKEEQNDIARLRHRIAELDAEAVDRGVLLFTDGLTEADALTHAGASLGDDLCIVAARMGAT